MKKNKLLIIFFMLICLIKLDMVHAENVYKEYKIGDKITYNDIEFYVIADSDSKSDRVTMLKAEPLTVDEVNTYGVGHVNMYVPSSWEEYQTAYDSNGYGGMVYYSSSTCGYNGSNWVYDGCTTDYDESEIKYVVDAWSNDKITNSDLVEDAVGYKVRLLTFEDLTTNLGYVREDGGASMSLNTEKTPSWVYNSGDWYWTMSPLDNSAFYVWRVNNNGSVYGYSVHDGSGVVRPVITIKKEPIETKKLTDKEFKIGDIVEYNNMLFYVIKDSTEKDSSVTLLKADPLTYEEIQKYLAGTGASMYDSDDYGYTQYGMTSEYETSYVKVAVNAWTNDKLNASDLKEDSLGYKARLITFEELKNNLGYFIKDGETWYTATSDVTPKWVYNSSYWTMIPYEDSTSNMWVVLRNCVYNFDVGAAYSVRPVVTLKKIAEENNEKAETEKEEDNIKNEVTEDNNKPNQVVSVPDTLLKKPFIFVVLGVILIAISTTIYILIRRKNKIKKK